MSHLTASAIELARRIRDGEASSVDIVEAHIEQIQRVNGALNAVVQPRFDVARAEAATADRELAEAGPEELPPLHGVPCTIKECFALEGMKQCAGLESQRHHVPHEQAPTVTRLRGAGAIPLGVTNLSELCMWLESNNRVYGRTNNPYDLNRIVGGSSGGEGAIVGAGASPFGLGSDIGGSIRMPAFFCGVFGHKPSGGVVPGTGQYPVAHGDALRYLTTGPLARRAEDLMPLLRLLAGPDGQDTGCEPIELGEVDAVDLAGLTVLHIPDNGRTPVSRELRDAQRRVADRLEALGATVRTPSLHRLKRSFDIWGAMLHEAGGPSFAELMANGNGSWRSTFALARWFTGGGVHTLPAIALALFEQTADVPRGRVAKWAAQGEELRLELEDALGNDGVMLYPPYARTAPKHYYPLLRPFEWVYTAILNVMQLPSTQVPLGLDSRGLPLGVQVAAAHGNDHLTIAVAQELERSFGGWTPPDRWMASA
ncbi:MAG: amidase [Proteobacteria bacterium]|nr:amidase [Pseudomonadota bacterium]